MLGPKLRELTSDDILKYVAVVQSEHYIAKGIVRKLKEMDLDLQQSSSFNYMLVISDSGVVNGKKVIPGGSNFFTQETILFLGSRMRSTKTQRQLLSIDGEEKELSTKEQIYISFWDRAKTRVKGNSIEVKSINEGKKLSL